MTNTASSTDPNIAPDTACTHSAGRSSGETAAQRERRVLLPRLSRTVGLAGAAALGLGMALAAPAWAHDTLVGSTPEDGEALDESPEEIVLEFSGDGLTEGDEITNEIRVLDEDGEDRAGQTEVEGSSMSASVEEGLPEGGYEIVYRVVYSDGHSEEQSLTFEVEEAGDEDGPTAEDAEEGTAEDDDAASEDEVAGGAEGDAASEDGTAEETDPAVEEGTVPAWALWGSAAAVVVVAVLVAVTVRRKLKE